MRIVAVRERTIELSSATRNSSISFDAMTASVIAVHTDASENGKPLVGLAFDSIGRYGHGGLLRERFMPRLVAADPSDYADGNGGIDPHRAWAVLMKDEKPGGHGERCGATQPGRQHFGRGQGVGPSIFASVPTSRADECCHAAVNTGPKGAIGNAVSR
jgi:hypothetical protein